MIIRAGSVNKCRAKCMNVDWAVAIGVFMMFVIWSAVYYTSFFSMTPDVSEGTGALSLKVMDFLETEEYAIPVSYDSPASGQGVLYADVSVPGEAESGLRVLEDGSDLDCMLQGDRLYWESDLPAGENLFTISYSDAGTAGCTDILSTSGANQVFPLTAVKIPKVSQSTLTSLQATPYNSFRSSLGIQGNIRLEWSGPIQGSHGPEPPTNTDISVSETSRPYLESPGTLNIRIIFWE